MQPTIDNLLSACQQLLTTHWQRQTEEQQRETLAFVRGCVDALNATLQ